MFHSEAKVEVRARQKFVVIVVVEKIFLNFKVVKETKDL